MQSEQRSRGPREADQLRPSLELLRLLRAGSSPGLLAGSAGLGAGLRAEFEAQRVTSLIGSRLIAATPSTLSAADRSWLEAGIEYDQRHASLLQTVSAAITETLGAADIETFALKGAALSDRLHGAPGLRRSQDVDLLVRAESLAAACHAVEGLGYRLHGWTPQDPLPVLHAYLVHDGGLPPLELHWRVHWYETRFSAEMLERALGRGGVPRPIDDFVSLLLYYARDGLTGLRTVADIGAWWRLHGDALEEAELEEVLAQSPGLVRSVTAGAAAAANLLGEPIDRPFVRFGCDRRSSCAVRLGNWSLSGDPDQIKATVDLVDVLLAPPKRIGEPLRRSFLRPLADVGGRGVLGRLTHIAKLSTRFIVGAAQLARVGRQPFVPELDPPRERG